MPWIVLNDADGNANTHNIINIHINGVNNNIHIIIVINTKIKYQ